MALFTFVRLTWYIFALSPRWFTSATKYPNECGFVETYLCYSLDIIIQVLDILFVSDSFIFFSKNLSVHA